MEKEVEKFFVTPQKFNDDSCILAKKIILSGFKPDLIIMLCRGGCPVGNIVHEFYKKYFGDIAYSVIKTSYYSGVKETKSKVEVEWAENVLEILKEDDKILIVDDIYDSGRSIKAILKHINRSNRRDVKVATLYRNDREDTKNDPLPDFYVEATKNWIAFPMCLVGLTEDEIKKKGGIVASVCNEIDDYIREKK